MNALPPSPAVLLRSGLINNLSRNQSQKGLSKAVDACKAYECGCPNTIPKNAFTFQYAMQSCMLYGKRHYLLLLASMCTLPRKQIMNAPIPLS
jgi:hypothetical protein